MGLRNAITRFSKAVTIKKIVLVLVLIACLIFIITQKESFLRARSYLVDQKISFMNAQDRRMLKEKAEKDPDAIKTDMEHYHTRTPTDRKISLKGNRTLKQSFTAQEDSIYQLRLFFNNPGSYRSTGKVHVAIQDAAGTAIVTTQLDTKMIANNDITRFSFNGDSKALNSNHIVSTMKKNS